MDFNKKRPLGKTGLLVSRLGLAGGYGVPAAAVEKAFHEYGINYFYWSTPRKSGMREGLQNLMRKNREDLILVLQSYDHIGFTVTRSVEKGIESLKTDYADIVLLGWNNWHPTKRVLNEVLKLKESGVVRYIAISSS